MAELLPNLIQRFYDFNGDPLVGGKLFSYQAGTTTPLATYTDQSQVTPNTNPTILDSSGGASIWIPVGIGYKFVLEDSLGNVIDTVDNVYIIEPGSITALEIAQGSITPPLLDLSTLTSTDLPSNLLATNNYQDGSVTGQKIADGTIEVTDLDPAIDLASLTRMIEVTNLSSDGSSKLSPQFTWAPSPVALSNPNTLPTGAGHAVAWSPDSQFLAVGHSTTPFVSIYQRFGTSLYKLADPAIVPEAPVDSLSWSPDGQTLGMGLAGSPFLRFYQKVGTSFVALPLSPSLPGGSINGISFSRNGQYVACACSASPYLITYSRSVISSTFGYAFNLSPSTPQTLTVGAQFSDANSVVWTVQQAITNGLVLYCTGNGAPPQSGTLTGISTNPVFTSVQAFDQFAPAIFKPLSNPATLPGQAGTSVSWTLDGQYLAVGSNTGTPFLTVYQNIAGVLTAIASPATLPASGVNAVSWSPDGTILAVGCTSTPFIMFYQFVGGGLILITAPTALPPGAVTGVSWSANSAFVAISSSASTYTYFYFRVGATFTHITGPSSAPLGAATGVQFSPNTEFVAFSSSSSPFVLWYQSAATAFQSDSLFWIRNFVNV